MHSCLEQHSLTYEWVAKKCAKIPCTPELQVLPGSCQSQVLALAPGSWCFLVCKMAALWQEACNDIYTGVNRSGSSTYSKMQGNVMFLNQCSVWRSWMAGAKHRDGAENAMQFAIQSCCGVVSLSQAKQILSSLKAISVQWSGFWR